MINLSERKGDFVETFTGRKFWPLDPRPEDVCIEDIAHSLSMQCRFNGHCSTFYSVAEHSIIVAKELAARDYYPGIQLRGLLHDAAEAYCCDIPRPLKKHIVMYSGIEFVVQKAILAHFDLPVKILNHLAYLIKDIDTSVMVYEAEQIMPNMNNWTNGYATMPLKLKHVLGLSQKEAKKQFLDMFNKLINELK